MAITLSSAPDSIRPAFNPVQWVFTSSNVTNCDFNFLADLYVEGIFAVRLKAFPDPDNGNKGTFRIERILQDYLSYTFGIAGIAGSFTPFDYIYNQPKFNAAGVTDNFVSYYLEVRESYNTSADCTGVSTISSVLYTSPTQYAWNGALDRNQYTNYYEHRYRAYDEDSKFLSNMPKRTLIAENDITVNTFMHVFESPGHSVKQAQISTYDFNDNFVQTVKVTYTFFSLLNFVRFIHGPTVLNMYAITTGSQPVITDYIKYYTVKMININGNTLTETKEYEIDRRCRKYQANRIYWLNRLGGFDSYHFDLVSNRSVDIQRTTYTKNTNGLNVNGYDRGTVVMGVDGTDSYVLNSNWMGEPEAKWMEEMFTSPEVYMTYKEVVDLKFTEVVDFAPGLAFILDHPTEWRFDQTTQGNKFTFTMNSASPAATVNGQTSGEGYFDHAVDSSPNLYLVSSTLNPTIVNGTAGGVLSIEFTRCVPVQVTSSTYAEKVKNNQRNINYQVELKSANKKNIQNQ